MTDEKSLLPRLSIVLETSTWHHDGAIQLGESLRSLSEQTYPKERLQIVPVLYGAAEPYLPVLDELGIGDWVAVPDGTTYYEGKRAGMARTDGQIVAFMDADNWVPPDWAREIVAPFLTRVDILAVMGRTRFRRAALSRFWDILWWDHTFEPEGPIDKIGGSNDLAFRREVLEADWYPDLAHFRGAWERAMTDVVRSKGGTVWFAPAALCTHDYSPDLRNHLHRAYARGFSMLAARHAYPRGVQARLASVRWLVPWFAFPPLVVKDLWRLTRRFSGTGYGLRAAWKYPGLLLVLMVTEPIVLAGMLRSLNRKGYVEPP